MVREGSASGWCGRTRAARRARKLPSSQHSRPRRRGIEEWWASRRITERCCCCCFRLTEVPRDTCPALLLITTAASMENRREFAPVADLHFGLELDRSTGDCGPSAQPAAFQPPVSVHRERLFLCSFLVLSKTTVRRMSCNCNCRRAGAMSRGSEADARRVCARLCMCLLGLSVGDERKVCLGPGDRDEERHAHSKR